MAIITDENLPHIYGAIQDAARNACRKWAMKDWEDVANNVFERVWKMDQRGDFDEVGHDSESFYKSIKRYAHKAVNDERVDYMYFKGAYLYSRPVIVALLDKLAWGETPETLSLVETRVDIHRAYDRLSENYKLALFSRYALGVTPERRSASAKTLERATDRFMDYLNFTSAVEQVNVETLNDQPAA